MIDNRFIQLAIGTLHIQWCAIASIKTERQNGINWVDQCETSRPNVPFTLPEREHLFNFRRKSLQLFKRGFSKVRCCKAH